MTRIGVRDKCLNSHWFVTVTETQPTIEHWRDDYNVQHPHGSLGRRTPSEPSPPFDGAVQSQRHQRWGSNTLLSVESVVSCGTLYLPRQILKKRESETLCSFLASLILLS